MTAAGFPAAITAALVWGITFVPLKKTVSSGSLGIVYSMSAGILSCLALAGLASLAGKPDTFTFSPAGLFFSFLNGLTQFLFATLFYYAAVRTGEISVVAPVTRLKTVFVIIILIVFRLEAVGPTLIPACAAGLLGGTFMMRAPGARPRVSGRDPARGALYAVCAAFFWGVGEIFTGRALAWYSPLTVNLLSLSIGFSCYLGYLAIRRRLKTIVSGVSPRDRKLYFCHGILNYGVAYFCFFSAIHGLGVGRASVIVSAWPLISAVTGIIFYREAVYRGKVIGIALLLGSVYLAMF